MTQFIPGTTLISRVLYNKCLYSAPCPLYQINTDFVCLMSRPVMGSPFSVQGATFAFGGQMPVAGKARGKSWVEPQVWHPLCTAGYVAALWNPHTCTHHSLQPPSMQENRKIILFRPGKSTQRGFRVGPVRSLGWEVDVAKCKSWGLDKETWRVPLL